MLAAKTAIANTMTGAARAWIRYAPTLGGKLWLWNRFHWRQRSFVCRTKFGAKVMGNTRDLIQRYLYYFGTWEPHITNWVEATLQPGDGFIDVGANIGYYSLLASRIVGPKGNVVAIEAAPWIYDMTKKHVELNRLRNVRTVQGAAADKRGVLKLYRDDGTNIGSTSVVRGRGQAVDVNAAPLHEILSEEEVRRARIIKIDVEGAELQVLGGLLPLLDKLRPDAEILMEVSAELMPGGDASVAEIFLMMRRHGFGAFEMTNDYSAESYIKSESPKAPVRLAEPKPGLTSDVLFSRAGQTQ